jgi:hypothetical protein
MKTLLIILLISGKCFSQDSVKATILKTSEKTVVYKVEGYKNKFVSFDCACDTLRKGDTFMIPRKRMDSLYKEAKIITKRKINE